MSLPPELAADRPELTRVDHLLRASTMAPLLGASGACHVLDAKYRPGTECTVLYNVGGTLVSGRLRLDGSEPDVQWWRFPDDPELPGLRVMTDPAVLTATLREALPVRGARATLLRYRPHRRATFLIRARSGDRAVSYVAKAYHDAGKAGAVFADCCALGGELGPVALAEPVAFLPESRLVLQRVVPGRPLDGFLGDRRGAAPDLPDALRTAAAALAALHSGLPVSDRERPVLAELARFRKRAAAVATVRPVLADAILALCAELDLRAVEPLGKTGPVHGDCKPSQFLLDAQGMALLDFDHCGLADPASDLGTFLAALRHRAIVGAAPPGADRLPAALLDGYAADPRTTARARWYEAVALVRKALRAFARAPRSPLPAALVAAAWAPLLLENPMAGRPLLEDAAR